MHAEAKPESTLRRLANDLRLDDDEMRHLSQFQKVVCAQPECIASGHKG